MNAEGIVLTVIDRFAGGRRLTFGDYGEFVIPEYKGDLTRDGEVIGKVEYTYSRAFVETEEPLPATLLALLLVSGLYPNYYLGVS